MWKQLLSSIAPTIATALGGPFAGMAVNKLSQVLLGTDDAPQSDIESALMSATPDQLAKIKEIDNTFKLEMEKLGVDLERIASDDRTNARNREILTKDNAPKILAAVIIIGFFSTLYTIAFVPIPDSATAPVNILLGALTAMLNQVGNYYFGSSAGSARKSELLVKK